MRPISAVRLQVDFEPPPSIICLCISLFITLYLSFIYLPIYLYIYLYIYISVLYISFKILNQNLSIQAPIL